MKRLLLALFGLAFLAVPVLAQGVGPPNAVLCSGHQSVASGSGTVRAVSGLSGARTYICGWSATGNGTLQLLYGQGSTCGTNQVSATPVFSLSPGVPFVDHIDFSALSPTALFTSVCVNSSGPIDIVIYYSQF